MLRRLIALCLCLIPALATAAPEVYEHQLDNGLRILVKPDHRAPILITQVWYRVGASYEHGGITGLSHLLEHMMFKGTKTVGPGEFSRIISENGGDQNAFTSRDYTAYFEKLASDRLDVAFRLESDRMRNLALDPKEFAKELQVVKEERYMRTDDDPQSLTYERFNAAAYEASPYHHPVIGWQGDLDHVTIDDVRAWYRKWYAPNNATLVVAGDVDPRQVFDLAQKYFGPLEAEQITPPKSRPDPEPLGEKRLIVKAPAKEPYLVMGYKTPSLTSDPQSREPYALEMLSAILDGGDSSRFSRELIRGRQIAASAGTSYSAFSRLPGMFIIEGIPASGHTIAELEQALREQITALQKQPVSAEELERVRNQLIAAKVYARDSLFYQAMQLGSLDAIGLDWHLAETHVDALTAVTPEQIRQVAQKYLTPDRLTVATLDPQPIDPAQAARQATLQGGSSDVR